MSTKLKNFSIILLAIIYCVKSDCVCNVRNNGEYCGSELNRMNRNNDCKRDQYYCGYSNRNQKAIVVKQCAKGSECDVIGDEGNACLTDIDCECGQNMRPNRRYCGNALKGRDCNPSVVFMCGPNYPEPVDGCPNGCQNGKCISG